MHLVDISTDHLDIKRLIKENWTLYSHKFDKLDEMDQSFEVTNSLKDTVCQNSHNEKVDNLHSPM